MSPFSLSHRQAFRQSHSHQIPPELGLLGQQLMAALAFAASKFDQTLDLDDAVTGTRRPAGNMFEKRGRRWFLVADCIPGDMAVKAVAVTEVSLMLETAPVRPEAVAEMAAREKIPLAWNRADAFVSEGGKHACYLHRRQGRVTVDGRAITVSRALWTIPCRGKPGKATQAAVHLADQTFEQYLFEEETTISDALSGPQPGARQAVPVREMRLDLNFQQMLSLEQVPVLCLEERQEQRLELSAIMALQRTLLSMTEDEVMEWMARDPSPEGQRRALNVLVFVLAGRVRSAHPELTWREARATVRKLIFSP